MKYVIGLLVILSCNLGMAYGDAKPVDAPEQVDGWALGVGFGNNTYFDGILAIDVKSPRLFKTEHLNFALALQIESRRNALQDISALPVHVALDMAYNPYKEMIKYYSRIGLGMIFVGDDALSREDFFNLQFQLGVELVTVKLDSGTYGTFFAQTNVNLAFEDEAQTVEAFDTIDVIVGVRTYF